MTYRILVALDGSPASEAALSEVEQIALGGASVHLLHVVPMLPWSVNATSAGVMAGHDQALAYLGGLRERLPDVRGLDLIRTGDPADAILQAALEFNIHLIAMGTQVRTGMAKWFLGSAAERVVREAQLPVLLSPPASPPARKGLRRILVPLDGSEESIAILPVVKNVGIRTGAEVVFLHLSEHALDRLPPSGAPAQARTSGDPKEKLLKLADRLENSDLVFWQTMGGGDAAEEILAHADTLDVDLIAMSTEADKDREPARIGGVAMAVLARASRAVILQRPVAQPVSPKAWKFQ